MCSKEVNQGMVDQWWNGIMMWIVAMDQDEAGVHYMNAIQKNYQEMIYASINVTYVWHLRAPEISKKLGGLIGTGVGQLQISGGQNERRSGQEDHDLCDSRDDGDDE